jgi:hypothetical protein
MNEEPLVYWLDPWAWDKELELVPLLRPPQTVSAWLGLLHAEGWKVLLLPYDARISSGVCDGGHVVAVESGRGRQFAALQPAAIPELRTELPFADYRALLLATPAVGSMPAVHGNGAGDGA